MIERREFRFPPDPAHVRLLRGVARQAAEEMGAAESAVDSLVLVLDELANNAIEHGSDYRQGNADLYVRVARDKDDLWVDFEDPEMPEPVVRELAEALRKARNGGLPAIDSERGRGLYLISVYFEEISVEVAPDGGFLLRGRIAAGT